MVPLHLYKIVTIPVLHHGPPCAIVPTSSRAHTVLLFSFRYGALISSATGVVPARPFRPHDRDASNASTKATPTTTSTMTAAENFVATVLGRPVVGFVFVALVS